MSKKAEIMDEDNPEWTKDFFNKATSLEQSTLPESFKQAVRTKTPVSIRLSSSVVDYFRSTGKWWQTRVDDILSQYVKNHAK